MSTNVIFKQYVVENLLEIPHPSRNVSYNIKDFSNICDLLFYFLEMEVDEVSLSRVKGNFEVGFEKIYNFNKDEMAGAIEGLATNFEPFLRKLAYLKYGKNELWLGNENYIGLKDCVLFDLIESKLPKRNTSTIQNENTPLPTSLVKTTGISKAVLDFVRSELRNAVHSAKLYNRFQLVKYSNIVLGAYLIVVQDNVDFLKKIFYPEISYLERIISDVEISRINRFYIDLDGSEKIINFENYAIEQFNGKMLIESLSESDEDINTGENFEQIDGNVARIDTVQNIAKDTSNFILIGEPGSGKSTSLLRLKYLFANEKLEGTGNGKIPIYIKASSYNSSTSFLQLANNEIGGISFDEIIQKSKVLILIDGLNEIVDDFKLIAYADLKQFISKYSQVDFILSTRKTSSYSEFDFKVFEIKKLTEKQIQQFSVSYLGEEKGKFLYEQINRNKQILELSSNPLMLMMVLKASRIKGVSLPKNRGLLFKIFTDALLERERKIYNTNIETKKDILSSFAYWMRLNGFSKTIKLEIAKEKIKVYTTENNLHIGVNEMINEFIDNSILIKRNEEIEFYHETQLEYFVALEIRRQFLIKQSLEFDYSESKWFESISMCSDLFSTDEERLLFFEFLYIGTKNSTSKVIKDFDEKDVNNNYNIACKIAYNIKEYQPKIYELSTKYLNNYLSLYLLRYKSGTQIIDLSVLLKAIASASNPLLFEKFFLNLGVLEGLFYDELVEQNERHSNEMKVLNQKLERQFIDFNDSLSDFKAFYKFTQDNAVQIKNLQSVSRSVYSHFKLFQTYVVQNTPLIYLIQCFEENRNKELLFQIGKIDVDYFLENFEKIGLGLVKKFEFLSKYHYLNSNVLSLLVEVAKDPGIDSNIRVLIIKSFSEREISLNALLGTLKHIVDSNDSIFYDETIRSILNKIPTRLLTDFGFMPILNTPIIDIKPVNLKLLETANNYQIFEYRQSQISIQEISINLTQFVLNEKFVDFEVISDRRKYKVVSNVIVITAKKEIILFIYEKFRNGGFFDLFYSTGTKQAVIKNIPFISITQHENNSSLYLDIDSKHQNIIETIFYENSKVMVLIEQVYLARVNDISSIQTKIILKTKKIIEEFDRNCSFSIHKVSIDFDKPLLYQRDNLISNNAVLRFLKGNIDRIEVSKFIRVNGLSYLFTDLISGLNYGIIVKRNLHFTYIIYSLKTKSVQLVYSIANLQNYNIEVNDLVLIEQNKFISKADTSQIKSHYFHKGVIVSVNSERSEGFIREDGVEGDFYITAYQCNFPIVLGIKVEFIHGENYFKPYKGKKMGFCVRISESQNDVAVVYKIVPKENYINVYLTDSIRNIELFARVYEDNFYIDINSIDINKRYFYTLPQGYTSSRATKKVYLLREFIF